MKKIVVLGGTGFLGSKVMGLLTDKKKFRVFSISRGGGTNIKNFSQFAKKLEEIRPDVIINCAGNNGSILYSAKYAGDIIDDNLQMSLNVYRAAKDVCPQTKIINPIGNCSYPGKADVQTESRWQDGPLHDSVIAAGFVKRALYPIAESYRKQYGIKTVNWVVCNPYGPEELNFDKMHALNGIIVRMIKAQINKDREFEILGTGRPIREWQYIGDTARIMVYSIDNVGEQTYPVNVAQNKGYSIAEIAEIVAKQLRYKVKFVFNTNFPDGAPVKIMDDKLFRSKYPAFKFTPLEKGIGVTINHFKKLINEILHAK